MDRFSLLKRVTLGGQSREKSGRVVQVQAVSWEGKGGTQRLPGRSESPWECLDAATEFCGTYTRVSVARSPAWIGRWSRGRGWATLSPCEPLPALDMCELFLTRAQVRILSRMESPDPL